MRCPTCETEVETFHQRSHIIPDWMYDSVYSKNHKLLQLDMNDLRADKKQSAPYGSYWCDKCETYSNDGDSYASLILTDNSPDSLERKAIRKQIIEVGKNNSGKIVKAELWHGINFKRLQNFVFSTVLRAELNQRSNGIRFMSNESFNRMNVIYQDPSLIDDEIFPIFIFKSPDDSQYREFSFLPCKGTAGDIIFRGAGYEFHIFDLKERKPDLAMAIRLTKEGFVPMALQPFTETGTFKNAIGKFKIIGDKFPPNIFSGNRASRRHANKINKTSSLKAKK